MSKKHYATRQFTDAGTTRAFAPGDHVDVTEAELANYRAAGLVTTDGPQEPEAPVADVTAPPAKPKRTRTRKSSTTLN